MRAWARLLWLLGRMGPRERAAQDLLADLEGAALTVDEAEGLSEDVWRARAEDRRALFGEGPDR